MLTSIIIKSFRQFLILLRLSNLGKLIRIVPDWGVSILCIGANWSMLLIIIIRTTQKYCWRRCYVSLMNERPIEDVLGLNHVIVLQNGNL